MISTGCTTIKTDNSYNDSVIQNNNSYNNQSLNKTFEKKIIKKEPINVSYIFNDSNFELQTINLTLYKSYLDFYRSHPIDNTLPENGTFYTSFFKYNYSDHVYNDILEYTYNYSNNKKEQVEYLMHFISSIDYKIVDDFYYPYDFLYRGYGVCTEKSLLMAKLLSKLNYSTSVIVFPKNNHLAVGLECTTPQYDKYCFIDVTDRFNYITDDTMKFNITNISLEDDDYFIVNISNGNIYNSTKEYNLVNMLKNLTKENNKLIDKYNIYNDRLIKIENSSFEDICYNGGEYTVVYIKGLGKFYCNDLYEIYNNDVDKSNEIIARGKDIEYVFKKYPFFDAYK